MKLTGDGTAETTYEDENGAEWDARIGFDYQPFESAEYGKDGNMEYPGCYSSVNVTQVERMESILVEGVGDTGSDWVLFGGVTKSVIRGWEEEIHEMKVNQEDEQ